MKNIFKYEGKHINPNKIEVLYYKKKAPGARDATRLEPRLSPLAAPISFPAMPDIYIRRYSTFKYSLV